MVLKESFEYVSIIKKLIREASMSLTRHNTLFNKTETKLLSKVDSNMADETEDTTDYTAPPPEKLLAVMNLLKDDMIKLQKAIAEAKSLSTMNLDAEIAANKTRREMIYVLGAMLKYEDMKTERWDTGYRFNADGTQVTYNYKVVVDETLAFDRDKVREEMIALMEEADNASSEIDTVMVTKKVDFEPAFNYKGLTVKDLCDMI